MDLKKLATDINYWNEVAPNPEATHYTKCSIGPWERENPDGSADWWFVGCKNSGWEWLTDNFQELLKGELEIQPRVVRPDLVKGEREMTDISKGVTMGVGETGNLFVHGSWEAIKACQAKILQAEKDRARIIKLEEMVRELALDLESEVEGRRGTDLDRRIERDLLIVKEARELLSHKG